MFVSDSESNYNHRHRSRMLCREVSSVLLPDVSWSAVLEDSIEGTVLSGLVTDFADSIGGANNFAGALTLPFGRAIDGCWWYG